MAQSSHPTFHQICKVLNNCIIVPLPAAFVNQSTVRVNVEELSTFSLAGNTQEAYSPLEDAVNDPLFLADLDEIKNDFDLI